MWAVVLVLANAIVAQIGQLLLKKGMNRFGRMSAADVRNPRTWLRMLRLPELWGGMLLFLAAISLWMWVLALEDLSVAVPLQAVSYIILILLAHWVLKEKLTTRRIAGSLIISMGIFIVLLEKLLEVRAVSPA